VYVGRRNTSKAKVNKALRCSCTRRGMHHCHGGAALFVGKKMNILSNKDDHRLRNYSIECGFAAGRCGETVRRFGCPNFRNAAEFAY
jgi:hypothetical protein